MGTPATGSSEFGRLTPQQFPSISYQSDEFGDGGRGQIKELTRILQTLGRPLSEVPTKTRVGRTNVELVRTERVGNLGTELLYCSDAVALRPQRSRSSE